MAPESPAYPVGVARRACVLFVDDDPAFLETLAELMATFSQGRWEILTATSASQAFQLLQGRSVDLVVLDVEMQAIDGIQVLSLLNRSHPHLQKAVLTGYATENYRTACLAQGAELFLEKPSSPDGWASVHTALQQLLDFPPERGFRGVLRRVALPDILQMECLGKSSSVLEVTAGTQTGRIYIDQGQIVHAELGDTSGETAFYRLLALPGGHFVVQPFREPPSRSVSSPWEFLLMEAARLQDELQAELLGVEDTALPAGSPAVEATSAVFTEVPGTAGLTERPPALEPNPTRSPAVSVLQPDSPSPKPWAGGLRPAAPTGARLAVREVLICAAHGEILYEWNCPDRAAWINILEFVSQKVGRMIPGEQLGEFDRLEIVAGSARWVIVLRPGRAVLMGWGQPPERSTRPQTSRHAGETRTAWIQWLRSAAPPRGVVLRALRFPDRTVVCDVEARDLSPAWLDHLGRGILDAYEVLAAHRIQPDRLRWLFAQVAVDCSRHESGALLLVLSQPLGVHASPDVVALLEAFQRLDLGSQPVGDSAGS